jgi:uncharacterized protein YutE (UPF0331/DUF86 family)
MIDKNVILDKASRVDRHIKRVESKRNITIDQFLENADVQDILLFNLQVAIQTCIDIASHIVSDEDMGVPGSTSEIFYLLQDNGYINQAQTEKIVSAIGFRNLLVHEYGNLDLKRVYNIINNNTDDLREFVTAILLKCGLL